MQLVVFIGCGLPGRDIQPLFGLLEVGRQHFGLVVGQAKLFLPIFERGGWCAERAGPVDGSSAAHAAPLQDGDALVFGLAACGLLVERGIGFGFALFEVGAAFKLALFNDDDL